MAINHGASAYANGKCKCEVCRTANTERIRIRRHQRVDQVRSSGLPDGIEHGTSAYNNWGCRCDICAEAWSEKMSQNYERTRTSDQPYAPQGRRSGPMSPIARLEKTESVPSLSEWRAGL